MKVNPIQLQKHLKGVDYPAKKDQLIVAAKEHGADENVIEALEALPNKSFETPADVNKALGKED